MIINSLGSPILFLYLQFPNGINYLITYFVPLLCPYQQEIEKGLPRQGKDVRSVKVQIKYVQRPRGKRRAYLHEKPQLLQSHRKADSETYEGGLPWWSSG